MPRPVPSKKMGYDITFDHCFPRIRLRQLTPRERQTLEKNATYWEEHPMDASLTVDYGAKKYKLSCISEVKPRWKESLHAQLTSELGPVSQYVAAHISELELNCSNFNMAQAAVRVSHDLLAFDLAPIIGAIAVMPIRALRLDSAMNASGSTSSDGNIRLQVASCIKRKKARVADLMNTLLHELYHSAFEPDVEYVRPAHQVLHTVHFAEIFALRAYHEAPELVRKYAPAALYLNEHHNTNREFRFNPATGEIR